MPKNKRLPKSIRIHNRRRKSYEKIARDYRHDAKKARRWLAEHYYEVPPGPGGSHHGHLTRVIAKRDEQRAFKKVDRSGQRRYRY